MGEKKPVASRSEPRHVFRFLKSVGNTGRRVCFFSTTVPKKGEYFLGGKRRVQCSHGPKRETKRLLCGQVKKDVTVGFKKMKLFCGNLRFTEKKRYGLLGPWGEEKIWGAEPRAKNELLGNGGKEC